MNDTSEKTGPDVTGLFALASGQAGYFRASQARTLGYSWELLRHHAQTGRFIRKARGLYRLRDYPSTSREDVVAAWLRAGDRAVVSHESALDIYGLSDVIPNAIHLTVPRSRRKLSPIQGVSVHTSTRPLKGADVLWREGVQVTAPARSIVDAAEAGTAPEQIVSAVHQALDRGLTTPERLLGATKSRGQRVERLVRSALTSVAPN